METPVENNITDSMLNKEAGFFISNLPILLSEPLENTPIGNCLLLDTPPLLGRGAPAVGRGGGGMDIFWNYTFTIRQSSGKKEQTETF